MNLFSEQLSPIDLPIDQAEIRYYPNYLPPEIATRYFQELFEQTNWKQDDIKVFGKVYPQPRLTALYGENGKTYSYSGILMHPEPFSPLLNTLKEKIQATIEAKFTSVLLNLYRNGQDSNGWHSDDEKELGINPIIASLSLGAVRKFHLRSKKDKKDRFSLELGHGSLLLMQGETQHNWQHQIPKTRKHVEPRINLTFRLIK